MAVPPRFSGSSAGRCAPRLIDAMGPVSPIDCDVIQADGGTRTASITGGYAAARIALERVAKRGKANCACLKSSIAAVSVGIVDGVLTDLDYPLDSAAEVDMNVVMDGEGSREVQGTAEGATFGRDEFDRLLDLAASGTRSCGRLKMPRSRPRSLRTGLRGRAS